MTYSTGQGNGPFGLGWSLSVPGVALKTSKGIPRYRGDDTYILSGTEDLVLVHEDSGASLYRPRTEGLFARIVHHQETNNDKKPINDYWEVRSKDGLVSLYGTPGAVGHDPAVVADPACRKKVFAWKLTQTADPFGNCIVYEYERDLGENGPHQWDQLYLQRMRYVDYTAQGETKYLVSVTFYYADRPDPFSDYRAGFEVRTTKRYTRIEMRTHAEDDHLVRTYHLRYLDQQPLAPEELPLNNISLLHQICVEGRVDNSEEASAARNLLSNPDFTTADPGGSPAPVTGAGRSGPSAAAHWSVWNNYDGTTATALVASDFPGGTAKMIRVVTSGQQNGLVQTFLPDNAGPPEALAGAWVRVRRGRVCIGTGNGGHTGVDRVSTTINAWEHLEAPNGIAPTNEFIIYSASPDGADFDVAVASVVPRSEWLPPLEFNYTRFEPAGRRFFPLQGRDLPARSLANSDLELVDLFGNGLPDILEMNSTVRYWRNLGDGRFDLPREMRTAPAGVGLADKGVQLLDANGDGRMDLLVTTEHLAGYYPLKFGGLWDRRSFQAYDRAPSFDLKDPEVHMVDLDGDGVTDAIRSGSRLECFFNNPQQGWNGIR